LEIVAVDKKAQAVAENCNNLEQGNNNLISRKKKTKDMLKKHRFKIPPLNIIGFISPFLFPVNERRKNE
jgi:N-dimethylarginine dimethylaminohydrolase